MPSFLVQTLGCKLNQLESEAITDAFLKSGFTIDNETSPSVVVINTCTVTSKADQKARRVIRKALRDYPDSLVLVTGCYARLDREELCKLETGDEKRLFVFKGNDKESILDLPKIISEQGGVKSEKWMGSREQRAESSEKRLGAFQFYPQKFSDHTRSFLKIQDGCDKHCTYCRIRLARGKSISLDADEVLARLKELEKNHGEAVITGVNISQYFDKKHSANLTALLEHLLSGTEKIALRLSSLAPDNIDKNLADVLSHKRIRPHFHLSLQSGNKTVLQKMGRDYDADTIEKNVALLRRAKDDPFLACDIITGFPGETNAQFEETYQLCKKLDFAWIHVFPFSKRQGTQAWSFSGTVPEKEKQERVQAFTNLARQGRADYVRRWIGKEVETLVEKGGGSNSCKGVSENYLKLLINYKGEKAPPPGTILRCKIVEKEHANGDYDAVAVCN